MDRDRSNYCFGQSLSEPQRRRPILTLVAATLALAVAGPAHATGCFSRSPQRIDAFTGILDRQSLAVGPAVPVPGVSGANVAVVLSENTKRQIAWSNEVTGGTKGATRTMASVFAGSEAVAEGDRMCQLAYDPKFVTDSVMQPLVRRFHDVKIVDDAAQFSQGNFDLLALVDVSFGDIFSVGFVFGAKYETSTTINVYFVDRRNVLVGKVEVTQTRKAKPDKFLKDVFDLRSDTLLKYQSAMANLLGPEPASVAEPVSLPKSSTASRADRLREVEDLLKQGLLTPAEASQKKADILKDL
ncbi:MAG TPA: hypothetical protein VJ859_10010 [Allosphingosinicella sp.]|nr:hypothetical protein [Allosphingosinicella sp.]